MRNSYFKIRLIIQFSINTNIIRFNKLSIRLPNLHKHETRIQKFIARFT